MLLRLEGHFSYIDKYNKLKFTFIDDPDAGADSSASTRAKLSTHCPDTATNLPYSKSEFTVSLSKSSMRGGIPEDIRGLVGLDCTLHVKIKTSTFASKYEKNAGQAIICCQLILADITKHPKYL